MSALFLTRRAFILGSKMPYSLVTNIRSKVSRSFEEAPIQISVSNDGKTIVCWHPEQSFPYECSKPLPKVECKFVEEDSVLKLQHRQETDRILRKNDYTEEELMQLTYTPRLKWAREKTKVQKAHLIDPNPPIDRVGI